MQGVNVVHVYQETHHCLHPPQDNRAFQIGSKQGKIAQRIYVITASFYFSFMKTPWYGLSLTYAGGMKRYGAMDAVTIKSNTCCFESYSQHRVVYHAMFLCSSIALRDVKYVCCDYPGAWIISVHHLLYNISKTLLSRFLDTQYSPTEQRRLILSLIWSQQMAVERIKWHLGWMVGRRWPLLHKDI